MGYALEASPANSSLLHLLRIMKIPTFDRFFANLDFIAERVDERGFTRLWGYFIGPDERIVVFWRHAPGAFTFKIADTYHFGRTVDQKVREKLSRCYEVRSKRAFLADDRGNRDLRQVYGDYAQSAKRERFHGLPRPLAR